MTTYSKYFLYKHQETYDNGVTWVDVTPSETVPSGTAIATYDTLEECQGIVPQRLKLYATYNDATTYSATCDSDSTLTTATTRAHTSAYSAMTNADIGDCITAIDYVGDGIQGGAFQYCTSLTSVTIPNSVVTIGRMAFDGCRSISSITIPESVRTIREFAFLGCNSMTSARIPSGVTSISTAPYEGCDSLTSITVDNNNSVYDSRNNCNAIINTSTNTLIQGCNVTVIPNTVTSIGFDAFANFDLTSIDIPSSVTAISRDAFFACGLTSVTIPNSVTVIDTGAFSFCNNLTSVTIGSGVTLIGNQAFQNCSSLTSITINATTPPTLGGYREFYNTNNCPIYVPCESVNAYKSAMYWSEYADRITCVSPTYDTQYLTFVATESGTFTFTPQNSNVISYSIDNGGTWTQGNSVNVSSGDKVFWKGTMTPSSSGIGTFSSTNNFTVEGNAMSLLFGDNYTTQTSLSGKDYAFYSLFSGCTSLTSAENLVLPATTLSIRCYNRMFYNCINLTTVPNDLLPATTLSEYCYNVMFKYCRSLTTAPQLPATTLAARCYDSMFSDCGSLTTAPELPVTALTEGCYFGMFMNCGSLTTAPELLAPTLADNCYAFMFYGCTNLNYIKCLATNISASSCTNIWVSGVASSGTFTKAASMSGWGSCGTSKIPCGWTIQDAS